MQINEPTLQSTLREKYNIDEPLYAEGRFVSLVGDHAANLVCLGLGMKCLVIAKIVFSGDTMDYDLLSLIPLTLLSMSYQSSSQKVTVRSQLKPTQMFQLCSSANQVELWNAITFIIRNVYQHASGNDWFHTYLDSASKSTSSVQSVQESNAFHIECLHPQHLRFSESSVSLPSRLKIRQYCNESFPACHSADCMDVTFDEFVNDNPSPLKNIDLDLSNNNTIALSDVDLSLNEDEEKESDSICTTVGKFFRRVFTCFKDKE